MEAGPVTRFVKCRMCHRQVPEAQTFFEADGDRMCVCDWRCTTIGMERLGVKPHAAERLSKRLYGVAS